MTNQIAKITPLSGDKQGEEFFKVEFSNGDEKTVRSWDYGTIYSIPFLYQKLFCDLLGYKGFQVLSELIFKYVPKRFQNLRVLDVACGNGLMGKYLRDHSPLKIENIVGTDISPEGIEALHRDYPNVYNTAFIFNDKNNFEQLQGFTFNCLSICGGANQVKLEEIKKYISFLNEGAYLTFNLRLEEKGNTRKKILDWMNNELTFRESEIYDHRKLGNGTLVRHEAFMFEKTRPN